MSYDGLLIHSCTVLRLSTAGYEDGTPITDFSPVLLNVPCRFEIDGGSEAPEPYTSQRAQSQGGTLFLPSTVVPRRADRVRVKNFEGDWEVVSAYPRADDTADHHTEVEVELVVGG